MVETIKVMVETIMVETIMVETIMVETIKVMVETIRPQRVGSHGGKLGDNRSKPTKHGIEKRIKITGYTNFK